MSSLPPSGERKDCFGVAGIFRLKAEATSLSKIEEDTHDRFRRRTVARPAGHHTGGGRELATGLGGREPAGRFPEGLGSAKEQIDEDCRGNAGRQVRVQAE